MILLRSTTPCFPWVSHHLRLGHLAAGLTALLALAPGARAATNGFAQPAFRGEPQSEAALWEIFSFASVTPNAPNAGTNAFTQTGNGTIVQLDTNAFLTGSGNIYNLSSNTVSVFRLDDSVGYNLGVVSFQARTLGAELDYANVTLEFDLGGGPQFLSTSRTELLRASGGLGPTVVSQWQWDLTGLGVSSYSINFAAAGSSLSLDAVVLDTTVVPEPSTWALLALGTLGLFARIRQHRERFSPRR